MPEGIDAGGEQPLEQIPIAPAPAKDGPINARDAMRSLVDWRNKQAAGGNKSAADATNAVFNATNHDPDASADPATPGPTESAPDGADAAAAQQPPGETADADREPQAPSIEPPRSWSREDKELFANLPRETQERLADRERSRDSDFSRRQQEATEARKTLDAERAKVEQARTQYESALPQLLDTLQQQQAGEFSDVKTIADVEKLAREDWPRYLQWDLAQKKIAAVAQEMQASQQRQAQEKHSKFAEYASKEDKAFLDKVPDMADPEKASKLQKQALGVLKDLGFSEEELGRSWNGQGDLSLRDHRVQLLVRDAISWRDAQARAKAATTRPVPPVQRPGAAQDKQSSREQRLSDLNKAIDQSSGMNQAKAAAAFIAARRRAG